MPEERVGAVRRLRREDRVVQHPADAREAHAVGGVPEQPGRDAAAAVLGRGPELPAVGPPGEAGAGAALGEVGVGLVEADHRAVVHGGEPGAVPAERHPQLQARHGSGTAARQVVDRGGEHGFHPLARSETCPGKRRREVRPAVGDPVDGRGGQAEVGSDPAARAQVGDGRGGERVGDRPHLRGLLRVLPRPDEQPADLAEAAVARADPLLVGVAQQVGGAHDRLADDRDERVPMGDPRVDDGLARLALQLAQHGVGRHGDARQHRLDVHVDQVGELVAVAAAEGADRDRWHGASRGSSEADAATGAVPGHPTLLGCGGSCSSGRPGTRAAGWPRRWSRAASVPSSWDATTRSSPRSPSASAGWTRPTPTSPTARRSWSRSAPTTCW